MSNYTFNKYLKEAEQTFEEQFEFEGRKDPPSTPKERNLVYRKALVLFVRYINLFNVIQTCYDQILHPQKRRQLKKIVLAVLGRLIELKQKMVDLQSTDYHSYVEILLESKMNAEDLIIPSPSFIIEENIDKSNEMKSVLQSLNAKTFAMDENVIQEYPLTLTDAIKIIQIHERARQGKLRGFYMKELRLKPADKEENDTDVKLAMNSAALKIQKLFKGYLARRYYRKLREEDFVFLGMKLPKIDPEKTQIHKKEINFSRRKIIQKKHEEEYLESLVSTKERIQKVEGPEIKEDLQDKFRQFYLEYKKTNNVFPEFPEPIDFMKPEYKFGDKPKPSNTDQTSQKEAESSASKKADPKGKGKDSTEENPDDDPLLDIEISNYTPHLKEYQKLYATTWFNKNETNNFAQKHDQEIIKKEKRIEVEVIVNQLIYINQQVKEEIMESLKEELDNLKLAIDKEKGKKGKKDSKKKGGKKEKGKKGKKDKDITANIPMETLVADLISSGIIQQYPEVSMDSFHGSINIMTQSVDKSTTLTPSIGELRKIVTEYCILPLGFPSDPDIPQVPIPKVMLYGPQGTGKTMLVNAVASACNATLFNISPRNTAGQFVGKSNVTKMIHMVFKVAKAKSPSIVYIDGFEMIFAKKIPKTDTSDPKRIKKDLLKALKNLSIEDRVLVIGTSHKPWEGDPKAFMSSFDKIIFCPKPDYQTRYSLWECFVKEKLSDSDSINFSTLSRVSNGLTSGQMKKIVELTIDQRRLSMIRIKPITTSEFLKTIVSMIPLNLEEDRLFDDFMDKTPLNKKRASQSVEAVAEKTDKPKKKK